MRLTRIVATLLVGLVVFCAGMVSAQDYPNKPIRIVTTEAGGTGDSMIRLLIANELPGLLGQSMVVDNRNGSIVTGDIVARATPDGYTLLLNGNAMWTTPFLQKTPYDPVRDFSPITMTNNAPHILVVHPLLPVNSVKELIALAKTKPGQLNFASTSPGGTINLASELFKSMAGVNIVSIPYKGSALAMNGVIGGEVQLMFPPTGGVLASLLKSGRLKALAITTPRQSALFPELPTVAASGLPGFEAGLLSGIFAPAKTPVAIINRLNQETVRVLNKPEVKEKLFSGGSEVVASSPQESAALIKADMARVGKLIKDAGIKTD